MTIDLTGRLALVTGASRGIGRDAALALAGAGADIIAVARARSSGLLEGLDDDIKALGRHCTIVPMDIADGEAIDRLGGAIFERWGKLDILVGNAGLLGPLSPLDHVEPKEWAQVLSVNLTANWRLIRSMAPLLRLSDAGRAIFVTSSAAHKHKSFWGPYAASKAALEAMVLTFANEVKSSKLKINLLDPGAVATKMRAAAMPGEDPASLPSPKDIAPLFLALADPALDKTGQIYRYREWLAGNRVI